MRHLWVKYNFESVGSCLGTPIGPSEGHFGHVRGATTDTTVFCVYVQCVDDSLIVTWRLCQGFSRCDGQASWPAGREGGAGCSKTGSDFYSDHLGRGTLTFF